jgi:hypothetical protein
MAVERFLDATEEHSNHHMSTIHINSAHGWLQATGLRA